MVNVLGNTAPAQHIENGVTQTIDLLQVLTQAGKDPVSAKFDVVTTNRPKL